MSDKNQSSKTLRILGISSLAVAVVCVALRLLSLTFFYDSFIGYYDSGAIIPLIAQILPLAFVVGISVICIVPKLKTTPHDAVECKTINVLSIFPAAGFTLYTVSYLISIFDALKFGVTLGIIDIISIASAVCASAFFWLIFAGKSGSGLYVVTGTALIVHFLFMLAESYFDTQVQMNAPNKIVFQFAVLSAMLLIVNELRIGQPVKKPIFHLFSASVATVFTALSSIPSLISYYAGNMPQNYNLLFYDITLLLFAIYATARLCQLCFFNIHNEDTELEHSIENDTASNDK